VIEKAVENGAMIKPEPDFLVEVIENLKDGELFQT
jgi:hypothetical protein